MKKAFLNIADYDFHDGCIIDLANKDGRLEIAMESAELSEEEVHDATLLSKYNTLRGKLHLEEITEIKVNGRKIEKPLKKPRDEGNIASFNINAHTVAMSAYWSNYAPNPSDETDLISFEITAGKIYWENDPNMENPYF